MSNLRFSVEHYPLTIVDGKNATCFFCSRQAKKKVRVIFRSGRKENRSQFVRCCRSTECQQKAKEACLWELNWTLCMNPQLQ